MRKVTTAIIWDAMLSLFFRAFCTAALVVGVSMLHWTWTGWNTDHFVERNELAKLSLVLALVVTVAGAFGTFRRGRVENNFSILQLASIVAGGAVGVYWTSANGAPSDSRTLRRFPTFESMLLGSSLIIFWLAMLMLQPQHKNIWVYQNGAIVGALQILWGLTIGRMTVRQANEPKFNDEKPSLDA